MLVKEAPDVKLLQHVLPRKPRYGIDYWLLEDINFNDLHNSPVYSKLIREDCFHFKYCNQAAVVVYIHNNYLSKICLVLYDMF